MRRRDLILGIAGVFAAPRVVRAQQPMPVIGYLHSQTPENFTEFAAAFRQGLADEGFAEGRNLKIEYRWARGDFSRLPGLAADLVKRNVAVIATGGGSSTGLAAKAATATIPVVFSSGDDPVANGLIASLARPGGNVTGYFVLTSGLVGKRIGLLHEMAPDGGLIAALIRPGNPNTTRQIEEIRDAAQRVGRRFRIVNAGTVADIDTALSPASTIGAGALLIGADPLFFAERQRIVDHAATLRLPAIYEWPQFVTLGGLMSYGPNLTDGYRQIGVYTGKILKGAKPADLPVAEPTKFELAINMKTAKALGITVPQLLLAQAAEVIE